MSKAPNSSTAGFTIVETLIVLAIGGFILLIIFLAIPALQRSGRNDERRQDVQTVLQAVSNYELNHAGTIPDTGQLKTFLNAFERGKLRFYDPNVNSITVNTPAASDSLQTFPSAAVGQDDILINNHAKCSTNGQATNTGAGYSDIVAFYNVETGTGVQAQCQQL